jgi:hypothetical protein
MDRFLDSFGLTSLLDDLRAAYELAKENHQEDLQARLMDARRTVVTLLHRHLELHSEVIALQEQLTQARVDAARAGSTPEGKLYVSPALRQAKQKVS